MTDLHPALAAGNVAVVTGGASGIGRAAAARFASLGLRVVLADWNEAALAEAASAIGAALALRTDVADRASVEALAAAVTERLGAVSVLMNNAGVGSGSDVLSDPAGWTRTLGVNLLGPLHGVQCFVPAMADSGRPGLVINTGSKQGVTCPPGDTAYNVSKAGLKVLTEGLAHTLRNRPGCRVSAHLLVPGFTLTGINARFFKEPPAAAWTPDQVVDRMLQGIAAGEFYLWCEDNETPRALDEKRIRWSAEDIIRNRPALSRWHPDWKTEFERFIAGD